jgi:dihydrofolate reductase
VSWQGLELVHVVAMSQNRCIGKDNALPWHLPADLQHFKTITQGGVMVMGRKTFESIGRPLPGRANLVLTRNPDWQHAGVQTGTQLAALLDQAAAIAQARGQSSLYVIGGGELFAQTLAYLDRLELTEVHTHVAGDAFYPEAPTGLHECHREAHQDTASGLAFEFVQYRRGNCG